MSDLLNSLGNSPLGLKGNTPATRAGAKKDSTLHFESSINDTPDIKRAPSVLDLNGGTPASKAYVNATNPDADIKNRLQNSIQDLDGKTPAKYLDQF